jgi:hypothetical protein
MFPETLRGKNISEPIMDVPDEVSQEKPFEGLLVQLTSSVLSRNTK